MTTVGCGIYSRGPEKNEFRDGQEGRCGGSSTRGGVQAAWRRRAKMVAIRTRSKQVHGVRRKQPDHGEHKADAAEPNGKPRE